MVAYQLNLRLRKGLLLSRQLLAVAARQSAASKAVLLWQQRPGISLGDLSSLDCLFRYFIAI
jgi:hypothetical protein